MTTKCQKCNEITNIEYKLDKNLPFDWDAGFFCKNCKERLLKELTIY